MPERESQTPIEQNFDDNEVGLQPPFILNRILANYIKTLSFLFARDEPNRRWRMLRADTSGNLKVSNGMQSAQAPISTPFTILANVTTKVISLNLARKAYLIVNSNNSGNGGYNPIQISFGNLPSTSVFLLYPAWAYRDTYWCGDVFVRSSAVQVTIEVYEFF